MVGCVSPTKTQGMVCSGGFASIVPDTGATASYASNQFSAGGNLPQHVSGTNVFSLQGYYGNDTRGTSGKLLNLRHEYQPEVCSG